MKTECIECPPQCPYEQPVPGTHFAERCMLDPGHEGPHECDSGPVERNMCPACGVERQLAGGMWWCFACPAPDEARFFARAREVRIYRGDVLIARVALVGGIREAELMNGDEAVGYRMEVR